MAVKELGGLRISRRKVLGTFGAITLVSCGGSGSSGTSTSSSGTSTGSGGSGSLSCVVTPSATEGPYFVDETLNRSDLTSDTTDGNVLTALPLALQISVYRVSSGACTPLSGAQVDVWHADAGGVYSDIQAQNTVGQTFLRGYQLTDSSGAANFTTIYPGWYPGRTAHIHFKVRSGNFEFTSQWFMDEDINDLVYSAAPYNSRGQRTTRNDNDGIYNSTLLLPLTRDSANVGYVGTYSLGLQF
jgi:protocatechuate 3,4-dioxygenase beta subunit